MKPRSWMIVIFAIGSIALVIGIILGLHDNISNFFDVDPTLISIFEDFIEQYVKGIPIPPPII